MLVLIGLLVGVGCANHEGTRWDRDLQRATSALRTHADADSLAAAAVLEAGAHPAEALSLMHRAAMASDRPEWVWLDLSMCSRTPDCDPMVAEQRFRQLDPNNGAGWLGALHRAYAQHDEAGVDAALAAIGKSSQVNTYHAPLTVHLTRALVDTGNINFSTAVILTMGVPSGGPLHVFMDSLDACRDDFLKRASRLDPCRAAAVGFQNGDSYLSEIVGIAIAMRVWPTDSPQYRSAAEASRVTKYRMSTLRELHSLFLPLPPNLQQAREYVERLSRYPRAMDGMGAQLAEQHVDPLPPADWVAKAIP